MDRKQQERERRDIFLPFSIMDNNGPNKINEIMKLIDLNGS
ncbi:MAG: hypothetical protein ACTHJ7_09360 [Candidatus Nitrosocosmicus sp.]